MGRASTGGRVVTITTTAATLFKYGRGQVHKQELFQLHCAIQTAVQSSVDVSRHGLLEKGQRCPQQRDNDQPTGFLFQFGGCVLHQQSPADLQKFIDHGDHKNGAQNGDDLPKIQGILLENVVGQPTDGLWGKLGQGRRNSHHQQNEGKGLFLSPFQQPIDFLENGENLLILFHGVRLRNLLSTIHCSRYFTVTQVCIHRRG